MSIDFIPYRETGYFSSLICDYLEEKDSGIDRAVELLSNRN